jgi:(S)-2-hydroxyglutarate dehydrogenase
MKYDKIVVGGGLVGLGTALAIKKSNPDCKLAVFEKESKWAQHQSGRNSGVIHAGVYYKPGSKKAEFALAGNTSMYEFCQKHNIPHERCGKLIVATSSDQQPGLKMLLERARANGLEINEIRADEAREIEPHVNCVSALHIPSTGIVDYKVVALKLAELLEQQGVELLSNCQVLRLREHARGYAVETNRGTYETNYLVSCAGLHSDRIAKMAALDPKMTIIPFRGEYWSLRKEKHHLVKNLIYPVPNPHFPFLGVHMTRLIDSSIHVGPNAVLAFSREGYSWATINSRDLVEALSFPGFWKLANTYLAEGFKEMYRSVVKSYFLKDIQKLVPEIQGEDLYRSEAGVRAQGLWSDGRLIDDFYILKEKNAIFVLNAPSPAATACLEIGNHIAASCSR